MLPYFILLLMVIYDFINEWKLSLDYFEASLILVNVVRFLHDFVFHHIVLSQRIFILLGIYLIEAVLLYLLLNEEALPLLIRQFCYLLVDFSDPLIK